MPLHRPVLQTLIPTPARRVGGLSRPRLPWRGGAGGQARRRLLGAFVAACFGACVGTARAEGIDLSASGFATLGYTQSNQDFRWQGQIRDEGGFERDSLIGGQVDARFSPHWSATVQVLGQPSRVQYGKWELETTWAFLAWRPNDDWLLRAGKHRVPLYLYSETQDMGAVSDFLRLPPEQYWIAPMSDFTGIYATRMWSIGSQELTLDAYAGRSESEYQSWTVDGLPPMVEPGVVRQPIDIRASGLVLTARGADTLWRLSVHRARTSAKDDHMAMVVSYPWVELAPGIGYWQVDDSMPGPGVRRTSAVRNWFLTAGFEWQFGEGWRLAAEGTSIRQRGEGIGMELLAGYTALFKTVGRTTAYASVSRMLAGKRQREWYERLTGNRVPDALPGAGQINAAQTLAGELTPSFDQHSWSFGASYALTPTSRLKAEFARTHIRSMSTIAWPSPGHEPVRDTQVDVLSLSYSIVF